MLLSLVSVARADYVGYVLDPAQSTLSLSVNFLGWGAAQAQGAGSMTTSLSGTLDADRTGSFLTITGGQLIAADSGSWIPDRNGNGFATASSVFGFKISGAQGTIYFSIFDLVLEVTAATTEITGGTFALTDQEIVEGLLQDDADRLTRTRVERA